jgi:hypothetical protein
MVAAANWIRSDARARKIGLGKLCTGREADEREVLDHVGGG